MSQNTRFLYGKSKFLRPFVKDGGPLWFRDIYSLKELENTLICDDESLKEFCIDSKHIKKILLNELDFQPYPGSNFTISQPTRRCHVLCLSNDGNKQELFTRFNADICIEINVELMIQFIANSMKEADIEVIGKDVEYFKKGDLPKTIDPHDIVFRKNHEKYFIENEFRVAIFWPYDQNTLMKTTDGNWVNVFFHKPNCHNHIDLFFNKSDLTNLVLCVKNQYGEILET